MALQNALRTSSGGCFLRYQRSSNYRSHLKGLGVMMIVRGGHHHYDVTLNEKAKKGSDISILGHEKTKSGPCGFVNHCLSTFNQSKMHYRRSYGQPVAHAIFSLRCEFLRACHFHLKQAVSALSKVESRRSFEDVCGSFDDDVIVVLSPPYYIITWSEDESKVGSRNQFKDNRFLLVDR